MSLRTFHMVFILLVMMCADLFGGWALHRWQDQGEPLILALGVMGFAAGLVLAGYALWLYTELQRRHV